MMKAEVRITYFNKWVDKEVTAILKDGYAIKTVGNRKYYVWETVCGHEIVEDKHNTKIERGE